MHGRSLRNRAIGANWVLEYVHMAFNQHSISSTLEYFIASLSTTKILREHTSYIDLSQVQMQKNHNLLELGAWIGAHVVQLIQDFLLP